MSGSFIDLFLLLAVLLSASYLLRFLYERFSLPSLLVPLLLGLFLASSPLGGYVGRVASGEPFRLLSELGVMFLLFKIGLQLDVEELKRSRGPVALFTVLNILITSTLGAVVICAFGCDPILAILVSAALATIAETTIMPILDELGMLNTLAACLILMPGVVDDVIEVTVASIASVMGASSSDRAGPLQMALGVLGFVALALIFYRFLMPLLARNGEKDSEVQLFSLMIAVALIFTALANYAGLGVLLGAVVAGIIFQRYLHEAGAESTGISVINMVGYGLLGPVFFFGVGESIQLSDLYSSVALTGWLLAANFAGKFLGAIIVGRRWELHWKTTFVVGLGSSAKFSMGIIPVQIFFAAHLIDQQLFSAFVAVSAITTLIIPFTLSAIITRWRDFIQ